MTDLIYGLSCFYEKRKSHRDIKPENIFIDENNTFKIGI
jgi:serine/threonine protein kinase